MSQLTKKRSADRDATFGRYRLCGRLAAGGMAEVWAAQLLAPGGFVKPMVIKRVLPELAENPTFLKMLMTEARVAARLSHANVCSVFELGEVDGEYYIAMEYLRGVSLTTLLRSGGRLAPATAVAIIAQACDGLHYAHEQRDSGGNLLGLVHRDVSPHNLFVTVDGIVKVLDFGIAKVDDGISERTEEGKVKGKLTYMSPEQLAAMPLDRRSDVWSLAVVLWELLAGRRLFGGGGPAAAVDGIRNAKVPALATVGLAAPRLDHVMSRALTAERDDRIASAAELKRALIDAIAPMAPAPADEITHLVWERCGADVRANDRRFEEDGDGGTEHTGSEVVGRLPLRAEMTQPSVPSMGRYGTIEPRGSTAMPTSDGWGIGARGSSETAAPVDTSPEIEIAAGTASPAAVPAVATGSQQALPPLADLEVPDLTSGGRRLALVITFALIAGAVAAAVIYQLGRDLPPPAPAPDPVATPAPVKAPTPERVAAPPAPVPAPERVAAPDPIPAPPPDPVPARDAVPDPAPDTTPAPDRSPSERRTSRPRPAAKPGKLVIDADPWATIYVDGRKIGVTPILGHSLSAGDHVVKAVTADGKTKSLRIEVEPGGTVKRKVTW